MHLLNKQTRSFRSIFYLSVSLLISCFVLVYCTSSKGTNTRSAKAENKPRRVEILFLGDNGHHKPVERIPALMAALGNKGINLTYTDKLEDINPENLAKYDGLMIYANWDSIPAAPEKALLDFVSSGKGLIPVHCASYCFRNSSEYVKMVGGQFWRHTMDTIQATVTKPEHPVMQGFTPFKSFDETYLHQQLQADNNVLMEREIKADQTKDKPNQKTEPYTWTRSYGKGRVFYTAYGHDDHTWSNVGFHKLMENGILWAVGDDVKKLHDALNPQPFAYKEANLPNYEKRPGTQKQQLALTPEESMKHIQVPAEFTLELFASEPNVMHPIALTWDERGRMYVLITKDYPNERKDDGGSDYILLCEDTNKDGKADKFTRFAEGLSIPTGLVRYKNGLIVSQAPHILYIEDTNGDDKADKKEILYTGFGTFDTHAGPSNLKYGFDNWIYGSVGYSGFKGKIGADSLKFGQGFFRFKPDGSALEYVTSTSNNTWGFAFNETGDVFGSTANNSHGWYMPIAHRFFNSAPGVDNGSRSTDTHKDMKPITGAVRQVDVFGGFTAAAGHSFYTARAFPKKYWNTVAFVTEPTGHIVHQNVMAKKGTDYEDVDGFNLLAGADEWVSPVAAEIGPDGAVWVADWYSFIIQHNPTPKGFENGEGNAYETDLRDYTHGRIYRVAYKQAPPYKPMVLSKDKPQELVAALKNNNMFWRQAAQRILVERNNRDVVPQLLALVQDQSLDEIGINPGAIHALWTLHGLGTLDGSDAATMEAVTKALTHACPGVRKTAVQVLPYKASSVNALLQANTLNDKEPLVVLHSLLALSQMPLSPEAEKAVLVRMENATESTDRWLPDAFACVLTSNKGKLMNAYLQQVAAKASTTQKSAGNSASAMDHNHEAMQTATNTGNEQRTVSSSNKPDLVITSVRSEPAAPALRETVRLFIEVQNQGETAIPSGTVTPLAIRIEGNNKLINMVSMVHSAGIAPGEKVTISQNTNGPWTGPISFNSDQAGTYTIQVVADKDNQIAEANENNNRAMFKLVYQAPKSLASYALERAIRSYTSVADAPEVISLLKQSQQLSADESGAIVKGVTTGWNMKKTATVEEKDKEFLASLSNNIGVDNKDRYNQLLQAWGLRSAEEASDPNAQIIQIKAVREALQFDKKEFTVKAGQPVEIVFENPDAMQHNMVIGKPKSLEVIGAAADKLITAKDGAEKNYVPSISQVIASTPLVNPDQTFRLKFTAPSQKGNYPFVCTFPGHWRIMNGVMKVE
ncbi:ThuA domain-containing protein [Rhodocytophaga aerolata]|uniref:ThuA domain-containing protein n=1 Tax=Rhodocytophaga aerolata TaxID=455078 RepID=A0ABT8R9Q8_9BACT|nr:PVC-type heme-binding CxxCH protein [Rhodocytophaga aerolata]MDO1448714.1 ThuA domain-containing protein [Rhodocytophaga aerolata]